eukprot:12039865-Ditylum_brightwellii.AAC.1
MFSWKKAGQKAEHNKKIKLLQNGCGPKETAITLSFLVFPGALSFGNKGFHAIKMKVGQIIHVFGEQAMDEAL